MAIPVAYNLRNLVVRKTTTLMTALGIALTVAVLLAMMALLTGLRATLSASGDPLQIIVMRKGSESELVSNFTRGAVPGFEIQAGHRARREWRSHGVARSGDRDQPGRAWMHPEGINVTLRGLSPIGIEMRQGLKISSGRWFETGKREVVVGKSIAKRYPGAALGKQLTFGRGDWDVVGVMDAGQSAQNSEIFGDLNQVSSDLQRIDVLSSALVRATDAGAAAALLNSINDDQRLNMNAVSEKEYYALQTQSAAPIEFLGIFVCDHHGHRQQFRRHEYHVRGGGAALAGDRHAARAGLFARQHSVQLLRGIGAAGGSGRSAGLPAGVSLERRDHGHRQHHFQRAGVRLPRDAADHARRDRRSRSLLGAVGGLFPARMAAKKEILVALREV